jgi:hypothetical protein
MSNKKLLIYISITAVLFLFVSVGGGIWLLTNLDIRLKQSLVSLENEFILIHPLPQAALTDYQAHRNLQKGNVYVAGKYSTQVGFGEIYRHYDSELKKNGWQYISEEKIKDWDQDFGGRLLRYRKEGISLSLQYSGNTAYYGWTYAISLSQ